MTIAFLAKTPFYNKIRSGIIEGGLYNGYVATDKELPISYESGADLGDEGSLDSLVSVHGGITYDNIYRKNRLSMIPLTAIPALEVLDGLRVIGFDTLHHGDTVSNWDFDTVKEEALNLMRQIEAL